MSWEKLNYLSPEKIMFQLHHLLPCIFKALNRSSCLRFERCLGCIEGREESHQKTFQSETHSDLLKRGLKSVPVSKRVGGASDLSLLCRLQLEWGWSLRSLGHLFRTKTEFCNLKFTSKRRDKSYGFLRFTKFMFQMRNEGLMCSRRLYAHTVGLHTWPLI